jgi:branched-chain amino acid transport system substrate-binding protein
VRGRTVAVAALILLVGVACSNASTGGGNASASSGANTIGNVPRETQGVTPTEIKVGSLASITGPLGNQYAPIADGVEAYLDMINDQGGVNGRKIKLTQKLDDQTNPSRDISQAQALNEQDGVFAVVGVAVPLFTGGTYLGSQSVPTFGWNVNPEWKGPLSLFGEKGSYIDFTGPGPLGPWFDKKVGAQKTGVLAYGVVQSSDCAVGTANSDKKYGIDLAFQDTSLPFGTTNIDADIQRIKQSGVQLMGTCMDPTGNVLLSRGIKQNNLHIIQTWPNGYDQATLNKYADLMEGVYFSTGFTPFQAAKSSKGMQQFLAEMHKRFPNDQISEVQLAGWLSANMFVDGLKAAGKDVTRTKLINAVNGFHDFTGNGIWPAQAPRDWTYDHDRHSPHPDCAAFVQVQHGKFVPVFGTASDPFICIPHNATTLPNT